MKLPLLIALAGLAAQSLSLAIDAPDIRFVASGEILADQLDLAVDTLGGLGSGLAYDAGAKLYLAVPDRGAGDGTIDYRPRFEELRVKVASAKKFELSIDAVKTTLLKNAAGNSFSGLIPDVRAATPKYHDGRDCIDPEAIAIAPDGSVYISDEYGPYLYQFTRKGVLLRTIHPPENYVPHRLDGFVDFADNEHTAWGRVPNHGFEGLALSPDGKLAYLILQSGLIQDGGKNAMLSRILVIDLASEKPVAEYAYPMESADAINEREKRTGKMRIKQNDLAISELTAINEHQFLVLERDNYGANGSMRTKIPSQKCIFVIDLKGATNLLGIEGQPFEQAPDAPGFQSLVPQRRVQPVQKSLLINFALPLDGYVTKGLAAKWEGIALTPPDSHGRQTMLVSCDNDFLTPTIQMDGKTIPFTKAQRTVNTRFLLFDVKLP